MKIIDWLIALLFALWLIVLIVRMNITTSKIVTLEERVDLLSEIGDVHYEAIVSHNQSLQVIADAINNISWDDLHVVCGE
jgi:hypothetical protein